MHRYSPWMLRVNRKSATLLKNSFTLLVPFLITQSGVVLDKPSSSGCLSISLLFNPHIFCCIVLGVLAVK